MFYCVCIGCKYKFLNFLPTRHHFVQYKILIGKIDHLFIVTILHIILATTGRDCEKQLPHTSCFKHILSSEARSITLLKVYLKEMCGKYLVVRFMNSSGTDTPPPPPPPPPPWFSPRCYLYLGKITCYISNRKYPYIIILMEQMSCGLPGTMPYAAICFSTYTFAFFIIRLQHR